MRALVSLLLLCAACGDEPLPSPDFTQRFRGAFVFPKDEIITGRADGLLTVQVKDGRITLTVEMTGGMVTTPKKVVRELREEFVGEVVETPDGCFEATLAKDDLTTVLRGCPGNTDLRVALTVSFLLVMQKTAHTTCVAVSPVDPYFQATD